MTSRWRRGKRKEGSGSRRKEEKRELAKEHRKLESIDVIT
jgi:hypothetical protein